MSGKSFSFLLVLLLFLGGRGVFAQEYEVRLQRPLAAGDAQEMAVTGRQMRGTIVSVNGVDQKNVRLDAEARLEAGEIVTGVDANGKETRIKLVVEKFTYTATGHPLMQVLPKGTVISCSVADKKQIYTIAGKPATPDVEKALDMVVDLGTGEPSKDEDFGTTEKKKKGDTWDLNGAAIKKALESSSNGYEFDHIEGKATLMDVTADTAIYAVRFRGDVKMPVPQGFTLDEASIDATYRLACPVDPLKYQGTDFEDILIYFTCHSAEQSARPVVMKSMLEKTMTRTFTPATAPAESGSAAPSPTAAPSISPGTTSAAQ